jgi:hypothetical protein
VDFTLPRGRVQAFADELRESTAGAAAPERGGECVLYRNAKT